MQDELEQGARALGLTLKANQVQALIEYARLIEKWNKAFNLVSRRDVDRLVGRHLLDSLSAVPYLPSEPGDHVLDIGSGAGLPGVALAIAAPHLKFVLCDRNARRVRFLQRVVQALEMDHVVAVERDLQPGEAWHNAQGQTVQFAAVVARAVQPADVMWRLCEGLLAPQGELLIYESVRLPDEALAGSADDPDGSAAPAEPSEPADKEGSHALDALEFENDLAVSRHTYSVPNPATNPARNIVPVHTLLRIRATAQ